ncbi:MAG TPA: hypothetical protein PLV92_21765, partial [Pirellulaceae bacterium]|nr:hypothetical protein [Pirellulaceae bacterium]
MKLLDWLSKIRKLWGGSKPRPPSVVVEPTEWYPRLYDTRLEPRQVLDGTQLVQLNPGGQLTVGAGSAANDGHADVFQVAKVEKDGASYLEVSVNDQSAFSARLSEIQQITVLGSRDADFLKIDPNALPAGGLAFHDDSRPGDAADSLVIQPFQTAGTASGSSATGGAATMDSGAPPVATSYAQATTHLGSQSGAWQATSGDGRVARIDFDGIENIDDRSSSANRVLLIDDGVSGLLVDSGPTADGRMAWHTDAGATYEFTAPYDSLTIAAANSAYGASGIGTGSGNGIGTGNGNGGEHFGDASHADSSADQWRIESTDLLASTRLTIHAGNADTLSIDGLVTNSAGEIELTAHDIVVAGRIEADGGQVTLRATDDVAVTGSISVARLELAPDSATGGRIDVRAATIDLQLGSVLDARGGVRGGSIVVFADEALQVFGQIDARGGIVAPTDPQTAGGFVETSSFGALVIETSPLIGAGGTWLIDPTNITISSAATNNVGTTGTGPITHTATASPA